MKHVDWWLAGGAGLYWAGMGVVFMMSALSREPLLWGGLDARGITVFFFVGLLAGCLASRRLFLREKVRRLVAACLILLCLGLAVASWIGAELSPWFSHGMDAVVITGFMVLWGFAFASMDKRHAGSNAVIALFITVVLMLAAVALASVAPPMVMARVYEALSAAVLVFGPIGFRECQRERVRTPVARRSFIQFVLSRMAFGAFIEFAMCVPARVGPVDASSVLLAGGVLVCCSAFAVYVRAPGRLYAAMPLALLVGMGALFLPFSNGGLVALVGILPALAWIPWSMLSSFQLSDLKERLGMGELRLSVLEKFLFAVGLALGFVLSWLAFGALGCDPTSWLLYELLALGLVGCSLVTSYVISSLVGSRKEDEVRDELVRTRRERLEVVYDQLTAEYGLSAREREVMEMLASGYTSSYVRDALGISDGTAKAHVAHIYQKLGVHSRNDLLGLVEDLLARA